MFWKLQALKFIFNKYSNRRCLGTRKIKEEIKVPGPNGKEFTKLIMADKYSWMNYSEVIKNT